MKGLSKKLLSVLTAFAMIFTIFASPVGEILGFVGETVAAGAEATALGIVQVAAKEIGTAERTAGSDDIKYNDWFYGTSVSNSYSGQYSWCSVFIAWCANQAGISEEVIPQSRPYASVMQYVKYYMEKGRWHRVRSSGWSSASSGINDTGAADTDYVPQQGDIVLFETNGNYNDGPDHIGLVDYQDGEYLYYIDGNNTSTTPHSVVYNSWRKLTNANIWGYCNPNYSGTTPTPDPSPSLIVDTAYSEATPFKAYLLNDATVQPYNSDCSTVMSDAEIWGSDECIIHEVYTNGWCKVEYPVSSGTRIAYLPLTSFINNVAIKLYDGYHAQIKQTIYTRKDKSSVYGEVAIGDYCYKVGTAYNVIQVLYPAGSYYKLGWTSDTWDGIVVPNIYFSSDTYDVGDDVTFSWLGSPGDSNLSHYWLHVVSPSGTDIFNNTTNGYTTYTFTASEKGTYYIYVYATPLGSPDGTGSKTAEAVISIPSEVYHTYTSSITKYPTCIEYGEITYVCERCDDTYTEVIEKTSHTYSSSFTIDKAATCTEAGSKSKHCTTAGCTSKISVTTIAATGHSYTSKITKSATCTSEGIRTYTCSKCGDTYTESIAKTSHSYTSKVTKQATCIATGIRSYTCSACNANYTETIAKTSYSYSSSFTVDKAATCTEAGSKSKHCTTAGCTAKTSVTSIAATNHSYTSVVTAPTCESDGYTTNVCKDCNNSYISNIVPAKGHNYTEIVVPPTFTEYGFTLYICGNCGYTYDDNFVDELKLTSIENFRASSKTANTITLNWTANTTATGYIIQQMKSGKWTNIANISNNATTTYTVSGLAASTSYSFRAVAYTTVNGSNIYGSYTASTPAITLPASITGFAITGRDSSSLTLSWAKNTSADGYVIQQQVNGAWSNIAVLKSNATVTYKVTELDPNAFYRFRMVAFKSHDGTKLYSKYTGAMSAYTAPAMVSGLKVVTDSETQLTVSWSKVDSANGYVLDIYKDGKWTEVARYKSNATLKYVATGLTAGTQYKFRIKSFAVNNSLTIYSTYSSPVIAVTKPAQVTGFKITANGSNSVSLSWNKMNASGYVIQCLKNNEWVTVGNIKDGTVTSYTVTGLTANSSYKFRMVAYATVNNTSVYGKYTAALAGRTAPAKVTNLTMTNRGTDFISVRWDKNEKADGYMVYIYDGTKWTCVKTMTSNSAVSHKITGLTSGKAYKITVKAIKTVDNVKYVSDSVTISATTL